MHTGLSKIDFCFPILHNETGIRLSWQNNRATKGLLYYRSSRLLHWQPMSHLLRCITEKCLHMMATYDMCESQYSRTTYGMQHCIEV